MDLKQISEKPSEFHSCSEQIPNGDLNVSIGDKLYEEGRYSKAFDIYKQALDMLTSSDADNISFKITIYRKLGLTASKKGNFVEARDWISKALELKENTNDGDLLGLCLIKLNLGEVYMFQAKDAKATSIFQDLMPIFLEHQEETEKELIACMNFLADLYQSQKKYNESLNLLDRAISIASNKTKNLTSLATSHYLKALILSCLAEYEEAALNAEKALNTRKEIYGPEHPEIATCLNVLGHINRHQKKCDKALDCYNQALQMRLSFLGDSHPSVGASYSNIGLVYSILEEHDKSLENYFKCLDIEKKCLGEDHPEVASSYCNIGEIFYVIDELDKALEYYNLALNIKLKSLNPEHHEIADIYTNMGIVYHDQDIFNKALESYIKALKIQISYFEEDKFIVAPNFYNLCLLFSDLSNLKTSKSCCKTSRIVFKKTRGKSHDDTKDAEKQIRHIERKTDKLSTNQPDNV